MGWIRNLRDQAIEFWGQTSTPARAGIIATALLCLVVFVGVGFWSSRPQYVRLADNLGPTEAAEIISREFPLIQSPDSRITAWNQGLFRLSRESLTAETLACKYRNNPAVWLDMAT